MASLQEIREYLNIDINEEMIREGKKHRMKNKFYYFENEYYIVELSQNKWVILDDSGLTRNLLRNHIFCVLLGYAATNIDNKTVYYHQLSNNYTPGLVADHINGKKYDNRMINIRICTQAENTRNRRIACNNTSNKTGVSIRTDKKGKSYWRASIIDNDRNRVDKYYSIDIYGYEEAKEHAINERIRLEVLYGYIGD